MAVARPADPASRRPERFPRAGRVRKRTEYLAIQNRGRRASGPNLLAFGSPGAGRLGITVSRRVGGAVVRNRVKRWIRECWRRRRPVAGSEVDIVIVARPPAANADYRALCGEIGLLARRLGIRLSP